MLRRFLDDGKDVGHDGVKVEALRRVNADDAEIGYVLALFRKMRYL